MLEEVLFEVKDIGNLIDSGCYQERSILPWKGESAVTVPVVCSGFFVESELENMEV
ncbi:MAG: hypothetical protein P8075_06775 [Deltaproteobacteria bacterium]|jgi:hypothetical protein